MSPSGGLRVSAYGATDVGLVRTGNEDNLFVGSTVFAVADGMGGHQAGEIASEKALEPIAELDRTQFPSAEEAQEALVEAIITANSDVIAEGDADPTKSGMGTTLTAVLIRDGKLHLAHVGDSRAYLLREGDRISQLTTDHTLVEQLIRDGRISREQAATHPQRSVVTRAIGVDRDVEVDSFPPLDLQGGDQVLLCSDGLTGPVSDERITRILRELDDGDDACAALIDAAKDGGGPDNITVVLLRVAGPRPAPASPASTRDTRHEGSDTGPLPPAMPTPVPTEDPPKQRSREGATPIITRSEPDESASWAERMGRYGQPQGAEASAGSRRGRAGRKGGRRGRVLAVILALVVLLALLGGGGYALLSRSYFVGDADGQIAVFNGIPQTVVGLSLSWVREETDLATDDLPPHLAERVRQGEVTARSLTEAREIVERYREIIAEGRQPDLPDGGADDGPDDDVAPSPTSSPAP